MKKKLIAIICIVLAIGLIGVGFLLHESTDYRFDTSDQVKEVFTDVFHAKAKDIEVLVNRQIPGHITGTHYAFLCAKYEDQYAFQIFKQQKMEDIKFILNHI